MGNCISISVNIPLEQLFTVCCPQEEKKTIIDLQHDWARLKAKRDYISRTIEESPEMRPLEIVKQWRERVAELENQVEKLLADSAQESANKCFCGYCPKNCKKSYTLWKQIAPVDKEVLVLLSQVPDVVVERRHIPPTLHIPTDPTIGMESMLHEVWSHVENQQEPIRLIGLHGMGGVGKTTLLKAVNNKLRSSTLNFDIHLWIVVSKTPNLTDIQNYIGEKVGFIGSGWKNKSEEAKALDIYDALQKKKYILLLDDIWKRFDLTNIGIPPPNLANESMVIFTTRSKQVCGEMRATRIPMQCLKEEEAWNLFKENVGEKTLNSHHDITGLAKEVMKECSGLPLALIVIGRAMTCAETVHDWKHAIQVLKRYAADFSTITDEYLNVENTRIKELPNGLKKLVKLKYLNVLYTEVGTIPEGVLLSMKELCVFRCCRRKKYSIYNFLGENLVKEFEGLKCLEDVTIPAKSEVDISNLTSSMKLLNCITSLHLEGFHENKWSNSGLDIFFLKEMKHLQNLHIEYVRRIKKIEVGERRALETSMMNNMNGGFNTIRNLVLYDCHEVKNLSWLVFCPNIERIKVNNCQGMQTLVGDENEYSLGNGVEPFAKLQSLHLSYLLKLESICITSLSFPCLNSLFVDYRVHKLKKLPFNSNSCNRGRGIVIQGTKKWWDELQWEDEATRTTFSSCFQLWSYGITEFQWKDEDTDSQSE